MSGFEWNKIIAAIILAGLIACFSGMVARKTVHAEKLEKNAYVVAGMAPDTSGATAPTGPEDIDALLATADVAAGEQTAKQCAACHSFGKGEPAKVGPNLWGIVGNVHAHMEGFNYSDAMSALHDKKWTYEELNKFIYGPRAYINGTKMSFAGLKDTKQRANVIAWLRTLSDNPLPLPDVKAAAPAKAAAPTAATPAPTAPGAAKAAAPSSATPTPAATATAPAAAAPPDAGKK